MSVRVAIVDDSAVVQETLKKILNSDPDFEVIFTAADPVFAFKKLESDWPDVIITDIEMPRMDGMEFMTRLRKMKPVPVVVCSSLTQKGSAAMFEALSRGAVDVISKPSLGLKQFLEEKQDAIRDVVKAAAKAKIRKIRTEPVNDKPEVKVSSTAVKTSAEARADLIAIGASTGGVQAIEEILLRLPAGLAPIVIVQHMPAKFTEAFANRLNQITELQVLEASDGQLLKPGMCLIAAGDYHLEVKQSPDGLYSRVFRSVQVNRHRPSVDVLFRSVASLKKIRSVAVILTGMGADGAEGIKQIREAGGTTYAQNEESCTVFGMPAEAIARGGIDEVLDLSEIPAKLIDFLP